jgi:hypothetical protein
LTPDGRSRRVVVMDDVLQGAMRRLGSLLAVLLTSTAAHAQTCLETRPTDPGGSAAFDYGSVEVAFFDSASGRARVHYALTGTHAPPPAATLEGVPDAVVAAAEAADEALGVYEELGFEPPLTDRDSPCSSNGDSDAIDIYVANFPSADGQAVHAFCEPGTPERCAGYVVVENDFRGGGYEDVTEGMRTVVPHELFHLVQNAYDAGVERWWAEGSAQWAAKKVYPTLRDLERFLPAYFENAWRPLDQPPSGVVAGFIYGAAIWPVFLDHDYSADVVREVYEALDGQQSVFEATDAVLQARGSSLAAAHLRFATMNVGTGERAPIGSGYEAAESYPMLEVTALPVAPGASLSEVGAGLGSFYYAVESETPLELSLDADPARVAAVLVRLEEGRAQVDEAAPLPATLEGSAVLIVAGQSLARTDAPFTVQASAPAKNGDDLGESGCSLAPGVPANSGALAAIVVSLSGLAWARARRRTRRKDA